MKCIRKHGARAIERVSNEEAASLVKARRAAYVPKHLWKAQSRHGAHSAAQSSK